MKKNVNLNVDEDLALEFGRWSDTFPGLKGDKCSAALKGILALTLIDEPHDKRPGIENRLTLP